MTQLFRCGLIVGMTAVAGVSGEFSEEGGGCLLLTACILEPSSLKILHTDTLFIHNFFQMFRERHSFLRRPHTDLSALFQNSESASDGRNYRHRSNILHHRRRVILLVNLTSPVPGTSLYFHGHFFTIENSSGMAYKRNESLYVR